MGRKVINVISIGEILGEPEQDGALIDRSIRAAMRAAISLREAQHISSALNVVFHVPGRLLSPDWDKPRVEKFSRKKGLLLISVPVPIEVVHSDSNEISEFVINALRASSELACRALHRKGMEFSLTQANDFINQIQSCIH